MKKFIFILISLLTLVLTSCQDDDLRSENQGWKGYVGKHFTSETKDFYWRHYKHIGQSIIFEKLYLNEGEFVEFTNLTDTCVTFRYGNEDRKFYNLADATDNQINLTVPLPYSVAGIAPMVEFPLIFSYQANNPCCFFDQTYIDQYGYKFRVWGQMGEYLQIQKDDFDYVCPMPRLRNIISDKYSKTYRNWHAYPYSFNINTLKCRQSPILITWNSTAWNGEIATLIPDASDFFQLLLAVPILKTKDHLYPSEELWYNDYPEYMSIEQLIRVKFPGVYEDSVADRDKMGYPTNSFEDRKIVYGGLYNYKENSIIVSKVDDRNLCVRMDADSIISRYSQPQDKLFFANVMRSLLSEDKCYFKMTYELIDANINNHNKEREFKMLFIDPKHSRNIMEYLILPLLIENKQVVKDFFKTNTRFSEVSNVLCSTVDRLEEIYAGTTDLTLGYKLMEYQWHNNDLDLRYANFDIWNDPEFE